MSARKAKHLDLTTMFTYSHANTPLGQSELELSQLFYKISLLYSQTFTQLNRDCHWLILGHMALTNEQLFLGPEWAIDSEPIRARGITSLSKISRQNNFGQLKLDFNPFLPPKSRRFWLLVGHNIQPSSSSTNQNAALIIDHQLDFTIKIKVAFLLAKLFSDLDNPDCLDFRARWNKNLK